MPSQIVPFSPKAESLKFPQEESWNNYGILSQRHAANFVLNSRVYRPVPRYFTPTICYPTANLNPFHALPKALPNVLAGGVKTEGDFEARS